jgi:hypothetical protein
LPDPPVADLTGPMAGKSLPALNIEANGLNGE